MTDNCFICETPDDGIYACESCDKALRGAMRRHGGAVVINLTLPLIRWAVKRARKFERERAMLERGPITSPLTEHKMSRLR